MKTFTAVPESITRQAYLDLMAGLGFDPNDLRRLEFSVDGVYAEVYERNPETGDFVADHKADEIVTNRVWIPVVGD